jgi:protein-L-isoaspartate(D-aspartate) O-methyltransferase
MALRFASAMRHHDDPVAERVRMVEDQIAARGIRDPRVLSAMLRVPRHELIPPELRAFAYSDRPLPIGNDQTISQPYVVAAMTEAAQVRVGSRVLEVGTGSGYQTAVLAELGCEVYSIEIVPALAGLASAALTRLGYDLEHKIHLRLGDGYSGWPVAAPFDAILVAAAPPEVPRPLIDQLAVGGRLVIPIGGERQELQVISRQTHGEVTSRLFPVRFVPMTGEAQAQGRR